MTGTSGDADLPAVQALLNFAGKVVVVTGAGSGVGRGIAQRFAEAGAGVVVHYRRSQQGARDVVAQIAAMGGRAVASQSDLNTMAGAEALMVDAEQTFGRIDVIVNNAGAYPLHPLLDMTEKEWDAVLDANLRSVFACAQAAARHMVAQGLGGAIVNIASIEAVNPAPLHSHYNAAKAGVVMFTRSAALELGEHRIRVNSVSPGLIWREGIEDQWPEGVQLWRAAAPLTRLGAPEDVADACLFLASPAARWITGVNLVVDGGVMTHQVF